MDTTANIRRAIVEVVETLAIAFLLVLLVIFLFLRHWRTTIIPMVAIPISLIGAFFIMYVSNFTINILTLLGIVLSTGIVVDDAIVVLENIYAKIEGGMRPIDAGHRGAKEIFFAIVSTTITLAAVFLPIIFLQGLTGRLFREFGIVVAGAVLISAFVSLTLTPMMSAHMLHKSTHENKLFMWSERTFNRIIGAYQRLAGLLPAAALAGAGRHGRVGRDHSRYRQADSIGTGAYGRSEPPGHPGHGPGGNIV